MAAAVAIDLHVHTALSPCGGDDMRPPAVLLTAEQRGLGLIGVVDHNTARNAWAFLAAAEAFDVEVLVGMEIESAEGVHMLALFLELDAAMELDRQVAERLLPLRNKPEFFGNQLLVDEWGDVIGEDERLLAGATDLSVDEIAQMTLDCAGMSIPAHVDRGANGLLTNLGLVPPGLPADLFEISVGLTCETAEKHHPSLSGRPLIASSDAHYLCDIGRATTSVPRDVLDDSRATRELAASLAAARGAALGLRRGPGRDA